MWRRYKPPGRAYLLQERTKGQSLGLITQIKNKGQNGQKIRRKGKQHNKKQVKRRLNGD